MMEKLKREIEIFKKVNSREVPLIAEHTNIVFSNSPAAGLRNQGIAKAKLQEYIDKKGADLSEWDNI